MKENDPFQDTSSFRRPPHFGLESGQRRKIFWSLYSKTTSAITWHANQYKAFNQAQFQCQWRPLPSNKRAYADKPFSPNSEYGRALDVDPRQDLLGLPITDEEQKPHIVQIVENPKVFRRVVTVDRAIRS
jgi:hypothetical protein